MLAQSLGIARISPGDILRQHVASGDALGREVSEVMGCGGLVCDATVNRIVMERMAGHCNKGFLLDGYPRTLNQAHELVGYLQSRGAEVSVIQLLVDREVVEARLSGRRECSKCGALYHLVWKRPVLSGVCDFDGSILIRREEDSEEGISRRLLEFGRESEPALEFLRGRGYRCIPVRGGDDAPEATALKIAAHFGKIMP